MRYVFGDYSLDTQRYERRRAGELIPRSTARHDPGVCCRTQAAQSLWFLGYPDQVVASIQAALALAQQLAHPLSLTIALHWAAVGLEALAEALATMAKSEVCLWEAELSRLRGELLLRQTATQPEEAETCFQQPLVAARRARR